MKKFYNTELKSAGFRIKSGMTGSEEQGRSMVEMLGVLAVMGVLSVGGVAMYTSAMNKHRANELLNEASKRAAVVAAQISMMGVEPSASMIAEFTQPSGYAFGLEQKNANQFNITIDSVDNDICTQMKAASGTNTPIRKINDTCTKLTFNNDMSTTLWAFDYKTESACEAASKTWCVGSSTCSDGDCCADQVVGQCQRCNSDGAVLVSATEGESCDYSTEVDGICHNGTCVPKSTEANCVAGGVRCNNSTHGECCPPGYLCTTNGDTPGVCRKFTSDCTTNADCTDPDKPWCKIYISSYSNCTPVSISGTCETLGTSTAKTIVGLGDVIMGPGLTNWWNAKNWCEAQGKHLINIEDFQVYRSGTTIKVVTNTNYSAGCASGKICDRWGYSPYVMWNKNTLNETAGDENGLYKDRFSPVLIDLRKNYPTNSVFWTASDYDNNRCRAFTISVNSGEASSNDHTENTGGIALCK